MNEDPRDEKPTERESGGVWEYVRRRHQLDQEILAKFARPITVMFTDIRGSTTFFDVRGDLEGVTMIQRHNELVIPPIEAAGGRVLARLGDGLLVTFPTSAPAVRAAIEFQKRLAEFNKSRPEREQIHVRVGINAGMGLVEEQNVFGDVVNVAARVETLAEPDHILVSESVYDEVASELGTEMFLPRGPSALKGKLEKVVVYEVVWSPEQTRLPTALRGTPVERHKVFHLAVSRIGTRLKIISYERIAGEEETLHASEEWEYEDGEIADAIGQIGAILAGADRRGRIEKTQLETLVRLGHRLYDRMLPPETRGRLAQTTAAELTLLIDDELVHIPWELMHDGREFLCLHFGMGRVVSTRQPFGAIKPHELRAPLRVVIISDAGRDLPEAAREGAQLSAGLSGRPEFRVAMNDREVGRDEFVRHFTSCDILHFAGHTDYDRSHPSASGFRLADGRLSASDLGRQAGEAAVPRVVFVNSCQSAQTPEWRGPDIAREVFGLANAFLLAGVKHYIGTLGDVEDHAAFAYAFQFYRELARGRSIGVAVLEARRALAKRHGKASLTWASYVLYGDPTSRYLLAQPSRTPQRALWRKLLVPIGMAAGAAVVVAGLVLVWPPSGGHSQGRLDAAYGHLNAGRLPEAGAEFRALVKARPAEAYEGLALIAYKQNDLSQAERLCADALGLDARRPGCLLMQGDVRLAQGNVTRAASAYESVIVLPVPASQRAMAFNRLGRVAAEEGQLDRAAAAYIKAQEADPRNWESLSNLGAILRKQGRYAEAVAALEKADGLRRDDPIIQTLLKETREADAASKDRDRQKQVDALVEELVQRYKRGDYVRAPAGSDDWTSRPLTLSLLGIESRGHVPFREGEYDFLLVRLGQVVEAQGRVRLVDRTVMDKLLQELKLSSSALVDRNAALRLGRLLSARLISVGSIAASGNEWELTVRVIETETSTVVASVAQSMPLTQALGQPAEAFGRELAAKLRRAYPLHARVLAVAAGAAILNIGAAEGAAVGQRLRIFREGKQGQREVTGEVEIVEVEDHRSSAKPLGEPKALVAGLKAIEL